MKKTYIVETTALICALLILILLIPLTNQPSAEVLETNDKFRITCIIPTRYATPFWEIIASSMDEAAEDLNADLSFIYTNNNSGNIVISLNDALKIALLSDTQAIVATYSKGDVETESLLKKAQEAGIFIVMIDSDSSDDLRDAYVGIDNEAAGYALGVHIKSGLKQNETALISYSTIYESQINLQDRLAGLERAFNQSPESLNTIELDSGDNLQNQINIEDYLSNNSDISAIVAINQRDTIAYAQLLERTELNNKIQLYGFDLSEETIAFMQNRTIEALLSQDNYEIGYKGIKAAVELIQGIPSVQKEELVNFNIIISDELEVDYEQYR